jgi:FkbM family methyltransferase
MVDFEVPGGHFGMASRVFHDGGIGCCHFRVAASTIDKICEAYDHIRVMKLDIEGGELAALTGAMKTLAKTDFVVVECNQLEAEISQLLSEAGLAVKKLRFGTYLLGYRP